MDGFIGEIRPFAFGFVPYGWLACNGASYSIGQYTALYAVIGFIYGGNNTNQTFQVPNLQGLSIVGSPTMNAPSIGHVSGTESVTLSYGQMPVHNHNVQGFVRSSTAQLTSMTNQPSTTTFIAAGYSNGSQKGMVLYSNTKDAGGAQLAGQTVGVAGSSSPHSNLMPYVPITYAICLLGDFPPRP